MKPANLAWLTPLVVFTLLALPALPGAAQEDKPLAYECHRAQRPIRIDGKLNDAAWRRAPWSGAFVDIEGSRRPAPRFRTRMKMLWDGRYLYVAAELEEPDVSAALIEHDSVIFHDNDFEVFLKPPGGGKSYFEFEINALNTSWDLFLPKPYREGGKADNGWEIPGLQTAVYVKGTLNRPGDRDDGWSVEIAFPWEAFRPRVPFEGPRAGDEWRVNFSRVEWQYKTAGGRYEKVPGTREDNWVWSPQYAINMHIPDRWGFVRLSE